MSEQESKPEFAGQVITDSPPTGIIAARYSGVERAGRKIVWDEYAAHGLYGEKEHSKPPNARCETGFPHCKTSLFA